MIKNKILAGHYQIIKKIGKGSFGEVYLAEHTRTKELCALKLENVAPNCCKLQIEYRLYMTFSSSINVPAQFQLCHTGAQNILAMEYLGSSLESLRIKCGGKLSLKTVLMLSTQMISSIEFIHRKNFLHRDIKPENFLMGRGKNARILHIIDFGLCDKYTLGDSQEHIPILGGKPFTGTPRYASINSMRGIEQSRRDDLESIAYVLIFLLKGSLPWIGISKNSSGNIRLPINFEDKRTQICKMKMNIPIEELCSEIPPEFGIFLKLIRDLQFIEEPKYSTYRELFHQRMIEDDIDYDFIYDWTPPSKIKPRTKPKIGSNLRPNPIPIPIPTQIQSRSKEPVPKFTQNCSFTRLSSNLKRPGEIMTSKNSGTHRGRICSVPI